MRGAMLHGTRPGKIGLPGARSSASSGARSATPIQHACNDIIQPACNDIIQHACNDIMQHARNDMIQHACNDIIQRACNDRALRPWTRVGHVASCIDCVSMLHVLSGIRRAQRAKRTLHRGTANPPLQSFEQPIHADASAREVNGKTGFGSAWFGANMQRGSPQHGSARNGTRLGARTRVVATGS